MKTAYIDTSKLLEENKEAKDIEEKYKVKSEEMGRELRSEAAQFQNEAASFKQNAMLKGQAWAEAKGAELQKREQQLRNKQQADDANLTAGKRQRDGQLGETNQKLCERVR